MNFAEISMDQQEKTKLSAFVLQDICRTSGRRYVPAAVSNRHIHLCREDLETLFGKDYRLSPLKPLVQPGQYAAKETVTIEGPKGSIENVRVLGPVRKNTQVEISFTDSYKLGLLPPIRNSGEIKSTPGCRIVSAFGNVALERGVILSARHLHISPEQAEAFHVKDNQVVRLKMDGVRALIFENVLVRCGTEHFLEFHLDTDEANAAGIRNGDLLELLL